MSTDNAGNSRDGFSRRNFLKICAPGAAAFPALGFVGAVARPLAPQGRRTDVRRVVIVGAGLAGLAAAYELTQAGHDVTVLEAQLHPGGRVCTLREPFSDGLYAEAGARSFSDSYHRLLHYARLLKVPFAPFPARTQNSLYYLRGHRLVAVPGQPVDWPYEMTAEERRLGPVGILLKYATPALKEIGDPVRPDFSFEAVKQYDRMTFNDFLRQQGASAGAVELIRWTFWFGEEAATTSALQNLVCDLALFFRGQKAYAFRGGNDRLPRAMAKHLADKTRYGAVVVRISHGPRAVEAVYRQADNQRTISGDHLICTVPFAQLPNIEFQPSLAAPRETVVRGLKYGNIVRVYLQVRGRFWEKNHVSGGAVTDLPIMAVSEEPFPRPEPPTPRSILEAFIQGEEAERVARMKEADRLEFTLEYMEKVHPGVRQYVEGGASKHWKRDAWSQFAPGQMHSWQPLAARPSGRLHFAGEHTSHLPGTMEGALESGQRAAHEVNAAS